MLQQEKHNLEITRRDLNMTRKKMVMAMATNELTFKQNGKGSRSLLRMPSVQI